MKLKIIFFFFGFLIFDLEFLGLPDFARKRLGIKSGSQRNLKKSKKKNQEAQKIPKKLKKPQKIKKKKKKKIRKPENIKKNQKA